MDLDLNCKVAAIAAINNIHVNIAIEDADEGGILNHFKLSDILNHFGKSELLNEIGSDECCKHFNLKENNE